MANIRRWMAEARALEEAGDLRAAIALHHKALAAQEETTGFADLSLYNGLGDLYLRSGDAAQAVAAFGKAAEVCEEQQLYVNGIALCKKILRNAPEHAGAHRRAGRLLAASGLGAEARGHYEAYVDLVDRGGRPERAREALEELVSLTADDVAALILADRLVENGQTDAALRTLRATRDRREEGGRDVVAIVRRIQELADRGEGRASASHRHAPSPPAREPGAATSRPGPARPRGAGAGPAPRPHTPHARAGTGSASERQRADASSGDGPRSEPPPGTTDAMAGLTRELDEVLSGRDAAESYRRALPILDRLLELQPERLDLLQRKLACSFALGDEAATVDAYLALGDLLDRRLRRFSIRPLTSSSASGDVTTALRVVPRSEEAETGS